MEDLSETFKLDEWEHPFSTSNVLGTDLIDTVSLLTAKKMLADLF